MKQYIKNGKIPIVIVLLAMIVHAIVDSIAVTALFNLHALEIILAGILLSVIVGFSFQTFLDTANLIRKSFKEPVRYENDIHKVHQTAIKVKKEGLLSLNKDILKEENSFLRDALILLNDYKKPEAIRDVMEKDIESRRANLFRSYNLLKVVSYVAPSFGLIGTLVGMIGLLSHLDQSHAIMQHMATALVSTLYGSLIASFIAVPLMVRVKEYNEKIILRYQIVMEGILMIATNDSTRNVFDKMNVMLDEEDRLDYPGTQDKERNTFQYGSQV